MANAKIMVGDIEGVTNINDFHKGVMEKVVADNIDTTDDILKQKLVEDAMKGQAEYENGVKLREVIDVETEKLKTIVDDANKSSDDKVAAYTAFHDALKAANNEVFKGGRSRKNKKGGKQSMKKGGKKGGKSMKKGGKSMKKGGKRSWKY